MKKIAAPIPFAGSEIGPARHIRAFFNSADEEYRVLIPLIKEGIACDYKAIHVVNPEQRHNHLTRLIAAGMDPVDAERTGQLELRTNTESYLQDRRVGQDRALTLF